MANPRISPLTTKYECPQLSLLIITLVLETNKKNQSPILLFHANVFKALACFEHSNFFKVTGRNHPDSPTEVRGGGYGIRTGPEIQPGGCPQHPPQSPTTSVSTAAALIYAIGAGITAAAGTRLALQLILVKVFGLYSFQLQDSSSPALLFLVTTSSYRDWVICAPAAVLGRGSRLSGSLSGIEP